MKKIILLFILSVFLFSNKLYAENLGDNYYPYDIKIIDVYIGASISTDVDQTISQPQWSSFYNPFDVLKSNSFTYLIGIRPLGEFPVLGDFRVDAEGGIREANYDIIYDASIASWIQKSDLPPKGMVYLKSMGILNIYYDFRWFSKIFYPYIGFGLGRSTFGVKAIDFNKLPSGVGEEYMGSKKNVLVKQLKIGLQYDTKIIKTSFFVEYRYITSGSITAYPTYDGYTEVEGTVPAGYVKPGPRQFSFKEQSITMGIKYYLY